ncbi:MAG TPA: Asp-tRNA(Asn)/Glu-tRNA(Gln) amidotransferase subunit GatC [Candidatus Saccharimonadales bacterium]|nr:Asp-tRNA(Asn)/Glu-tRNA(Gln) amidotransferase subunit GatC [Candidatus Saccharimonadales bacterium]
MSKITRVDVLKLASLSKIKLTDEEVERFVKELDSIVEYVEQINSADITGIEPTDQVTGLQNVMRPDEVIDYGVSSKELLKNAPATEKNQIKVKRILS